MSICFAKRLKQPHYVVPLAKSHASFYNITKRSFHYEKIFRYNQARGNKPLQSRHSRSRNCHFTFNLKEHRL